MNYQISTPAYQKPLFVHYVDNDGETFSTADDPIPFKTKVYDNYMAWDSDTLTAPFCGNYYFDYAIRNWTRINTIGLYLNQSKLLSSSFRNADNFFKIGSFQIYANKGDTMSLVYIDGTLAPLTSTPAHFITIVGVQG